MRDCPHIFERLHKEGSGMKWKKITGRNRVNWEWFNIKAFNPMAMYAMY